jgi:signal transduction histidine kinase
VLGATAVITIAQAIVIVALLVQRRRRSIVEHHLRQSETALQASYERIRGLGARLLHAQEAERSRIARELHDDVNQQLVLLAMELERVGAIDARDRAQAVARTVHDLSYRLHPEKLRLLGLTAALRGLERELSNEETEIVFTHDEVPSKLPASLTVSVYRVAQEALHNAVTHGRARRVFVDLRRSPTEVVLSIADDGVGFDVDAAWGRGLGLVSMRERVHAMGGTFTIDSQPGTGSRVAVTLPLEPVAAPAAT